MWPFTRNVTVTIRHEVPALRDLAQAIRYAARADAKARVKAARLARPDLTHAAPTKEEAPPDPVWTAWEAEHQDLTQEEREHWHAHYLVLSGREKASEDRRLRAIDEYSRAAPALDLPSLDARNFLAPE